MRHVIDTKAKYGNEQYLASRLVKSCLLMLIIGGSLLHLEAYENELDVVSESVVNSLGEGKRKKVAVLDFTDLDGNVNDLGRFVAEQMGVRLVTKRVGFSVVDRAGMKRLLTAQKMEASSLLEPEKAKGFAQVSGLDTIILGTVAPLGEKVFVTVKTLALENVEILSAATARLPKSEELLALISRSMPPGEKPGDDSKLTDNKKDTKGKPKSQEFEDMTVELDSLRVTQNGSILAIVSIRNKSKEQLSVGLNAVGQSLDIEASLLDQDGNEYKAHDEVRGIAIPHHFGGDNSGYESLKRGEGDMERLTPLGVGKAIKAMLRFLPPRGVRSKGSTFSLHMEILSVKGTESANAVVELNSVAMEGVEMQPGAK